MMMLRKNFNLRTFIFACQKISDIYNKLGAIDEETAQTIFFSVLSFSMQIKSGYFPNWRGQIRYPQSWGLEISHCIVFATTISDGRNSMQIRYRNQDLNYYKRLFTINK